MTTIYCECGFPASLVPVQFLGWAKTPAHDVTGLFNAVVRLKRGAPGYSMGEVLHVDKWRIVVKAGRRNYRQMIKPAPLPAVDPQNLIAARWPA